MTQRRVRPVTVADEEGVRGSGRSPPSVLLPPHPALQTALHAPSALSPSPPHPSPSPFSGVLASALLTLCFRRSMSKISRSLLQSFLLLWPLHAYAANFTFSYSEATECDDFQVSWQGTFPSLPPFRPHVLTIAFSGGVAPFTMSMVPVSTSSPCDKLILV